MSDDDPRMHFLSGKRVIVAGAGIAGLAFVLAMKKSWDPSIEPPVITIYDRDTREASVQREGYSLSLSGEDRSAGLYALKELGLLDEIMGAAILRVEGQGSFTMWTSQFRPMISIRAKPPPDLPTGGIRIRRKDLRRILTDAVSASTETETRWGIACVSARRLEDGRMRIQMVNEETGEESYEDCDLLIAADGASSKIRAALRPSDTLRFAGAIQMGGNARFEGGIPSPLDASWGGVLTGTGTSCFFSPVDEHTLVWAMSVREATEREKYDNGDPEQVRAMLREAASLGKTISEPFKTILEATDAGSTFVLNARDKHAFAHAEDDLISGIGPVIFIGDSNHAVSPFAGYGANLALRDGLDLAEQLSRQGRQQQQQQQEEEEEDDDDDEETPTLHLRIAVAAYDRLSMPRAAKALATSHWRIKVGHATGLQYWMYRAFFAVAGSMLQIVQYLGM